MGYAVVEDGVVTNTIVWDGNTENWQPPEGSIAVKYGDDEVVGIGYRYDGVRFIAPPVPPLFPIG